MATPQLYYKNGDSWQSIMSNSYPVGSIYSSVSSISPGSMFGGTWAEITGAVLRGNNQAGVYSDSDTHTLTIGEMPAHSHKPHITNTADLGNSAYGLTPAVGYQGSVTVISYPRQSTIIDPTGGASSYQQAACLQCLYVEKNFINLDVMPNGIC